MQELHGKAAVEAEERARRRSLPLARRYNWRNIAILIGIIGAGIVGFLTALSFNNIGY